MLKSFAERYSSVKGIRMCGVARHYCDSPLCPRCGAKRQRAFRSTLRKTLLSHRGRGLLLTTTVAAQPGQSLSDQWDALDKLMTHLGSGAWLSRRFSGVVRHVEVSWSEGRWFAHAHWLLLANSDHDSSLEADGQAAIERWCRAARLRNITALPEGQDARLVPSGDLLRVLGYITKDSPLRATDDGTGLGDLYRLAAAGDADALASLHELERASFARRWRSISGVFRTSPARS